MDEDLLGLYPSDNDDIAMDAIKQLLTEPNINRATSNTNARGDGKRDGRDRRRRSKSKRDKSNKRESSSKRDNRRESSRRRRSSSRNTLDTKDTKGTLDTKGTTKSHRRRRNTISDDDRKSSHRDRVKSSTSARRTSIESKRRRRHTIDGEKLYQGRSKQRNIPHSSNDNTATKSIWDTSNDHQTDEKKKASKYNKKKERRISVEISNSNTLGTTGINNKSSSKRDRTRSRPKSRGCGDVSTDDEIGFISAREKDNFHRLSAPWATPSTPSPIPTSTKQPIKRSKSKDILESEHSITDDELNNNMMKPSKRDELVKRQVAPWAAQQQSNKGMTKKCKSKGSLTSLSSYERDNSKFNRRGGLRRVKSDRRISNDGNSSSDAEGGNRRGLLKTIKTERRMSGSDTDGGGNNSSTDDLFSFANCLGSTFTNPSTIGSKRTSTERLRLVKSTGTGWKEQQDNKDEEENERYPLPSSSNSRRPGLEQQISSRRQERLRLVKSTGTGWKERHDDDNNEEDNLIQVMPRNGRPRLERSNSIGNSFSKSREETLVEVRKSATMRSSRRRPLANSLDSQRRPMTCDQSITIEDLERGIKTPICQSFRHSYTRSNSTGADSTASLRASRLLRNSRRSTGSGVLRDSLRSSDSHIVDAATQRRLLMSLASPSPVNVPPTQESSIFTDAEVALLMSNKKKGKSDRLTARGSTRQVRDRMKRSRSLDASVTRTNMIQSVDSVDDTPSKKAGIAARIRRRRTVDSSGKLDNEQRDTNTPSSSRRQGRQQRMKRSRSLDTSIAKLKLKMLDMERIQDDDTDKEKKTLDVTDSMLPVPDELPYKLTRKLANSLNDGKCPVIEESKRAADEMSSDDDHLELLEVTKKKKGGSEDKNPTPTSLLAIADQENSIVFESSATIAAAVLPSPESPPKNRRPSTAREMSLAELFDEDKVHSTRPRTGSSGSIECGEGGSSSAKRSAKRASESTGLGTLPTVEIHTINSKTLSVIESDDDHDVPDEREEKKTKKSGWYISQTMLCGICTCYTITLILILVLGIGFGYILLPSYIDEDSPINNVDNGGTSEPADSNSTSMGSDESIITTLSLSSIPSYAPSSANSVTPSHFPSHLSSETPSSSKIPSSQPSWQPTVSSQPTISTSPTLTPSLDSSSSPSNIPSTSPTMRLECPEELTMVVTLDEEGLFTMKYHVVIYPDDYGDGLEGILCASLEYSGYASWLGLALSDATRDPRFGRKEAIIGIPGIQQTMAVVSSDVGSASLGQQVGGGIKDGPPFQNPAKYIIPAGGIGDGYSGPSLILLNDKQTLMNGSVTVDPNNTTNITQMTFEKYLTETSEVPINPYEPNLFMYAAASEVDEDGEFDNSEWKYVSLTLLVKEEDDNTLTEVNDTLTYELVDDLVDDIYSLYVTEDEDDDSTSTTSTSDTDTDTVETARASVETANVEVSNLRKRTRLHDNNK